MAPKAADYGEKNKNFIEAALIASIMQEKHITPDDVAAILLGVKISRIGNLQTAEVINNEAVVDTYLDAINYLALYAQIKSEESEKDSDIPF